MKTALENFGAAQTLRCADALLAGRAVAWLAGLGAAPHLGPYLGQDMRLDMRQGSRRDAAAPDPTDPLARLIHQALAGLALGPAAPAGASPERHPERHLGRAQAWPEPQATALLPVSAGAPASKGVPTSNSVPRAAPLGAAANALTRTADQAARQRAAIEAMGVPDLLPSASAVMALPVAMALPTDLARSGAVQPQPQPQRFLVEVATAAATAVVTAGAANGQAQAQHSAHWPGKTAPATAAVGIPAGGGLWSRRALARAVPDSTALAEAGGLNPLAGAAGGLGGRYSGAPIGPAGTGPTEMGPAPATSAATGMAQPPSSRLTAPLESPAYTLHAGSAAVPQASRLVSGLPALQGLLQAAVAHSRQRHTPAGMAPSSPIPSLRPSLRPSPIPSPTPPALLPFTSEASSPASPLPPAPRLADLSTLDPLAEDMLVDRLVDRLQDRLREQTLRHLGFTGGWV